MNTNTSKMLINGLLSVALLVGAGVTTARAMHDDGGCTANELTLHQLKNARQATGAFNSIEAAERAGYVDINLLVPNMGDHFVNFDLVDSTFEAERPEALVYADLGNGRRQLVAVEYLAPYSPSGPPEGFAGSCDRWTEFPAPDDPNTPQIEPIFWTLHAWIWQPNMSGTFAKFNPLVP